MDFHECEAQFSEGLPKNYMEGMLVVVVVVVLGFGFHL